MGTTLSEPTQPPTTDVCLFLERADIKPEVIWVDQKYVLFLRKVLIEQPQKWAGTDVDTFYADDTVKSTLSVPDICSRVPTQPDIGVLWTCANTGRRWVYRCLVNYSDHKLRNPEVILTRPITEELPLHLRPLSVTHTCTATSHICCMTVLAGWFLMAVDGEFTLLFQQFWVLRLNLPRPKSDWFSISLWITLDCSACKAVSPGAHPARWSWFTFQSPLLLLAERVECFNAYAVCFFDWMRAACFMGFSILSYFWQPSDNPISSSLPPAVTTFEQIKFNTWLVLPFLASDYCLLNFLLTVNRKRSVTCL